MADIDTPTECVLLTVWNDDPNIIDYWTLSHQFVPFFAVIYGLDYRWAIIFIYLYETIENGTWCVQKLYQEDFANSIVADPIQGIIGVLVALSYMKLVKSAGINTEKNYLKDLKTFGEALLDFIIICIPSLIFIYEGNKNVYVIYLILFPISFWIISFLNYKRDTLENRSKIWYRLGVAMIYLSFLLSFIVWHPLDINSFYAGSIIGLCFCVFFLLIDKYLGREETAFTQLGSGDFKL